MRRFDEPARYDRNATVTPGSGVRLVSGTVATLVPMAAIAMVDRPLATGNLGLAAGLLALGWTVSRRGPTPAGGSAAAAVRSVVGAPYRWLAATGARVPDRPASGR